MRIGKLHWIRIVGKLHGIRVVSCHFLFVMLVVGVAVVVVNCVFIYFVGIVIVVVVVVVNLFVPKSLNAVERVTVVVGCSI